MSSYRKMAEFYSLSSVTKLEDYEMGRKEIPVTLVKKLEEFFFITHNFLDSDKKYIFKNFHLDQDSVSSLLDEGFRPIVACCPYDRGDLYCYIVMHKEENGLSRIVASNLLSSFASSGGGMLNIYELIHAMVEREIPSFRARILKVTENDWKNLENDTYYQNHPFQFTSYNDQECNQIFQEWFKKALDVKDRYGT